MQKAFVSAIFGGIFALALIGPADAFYDEQLYEASSSEVGEFEAALRGQIANLNPNDPLLQRDADAVIAFYEARDYAPVWTTERGFSGRAVALIERIAAASMDGLDPTGYLIPDASLGVDERAVVGDLAVAEIQLSLAVAAYTREAYAGRIDPRTIGRDIGTHEGIDIAPHYPDTVAALESIATSNNPVAALEAYNPTHAGYLALREALARVRSQPGEPRIAVPDGPTIHLGDEDDRMPILRARLDIEAADEDLVGVYDETLMSAVQVFQAESGLVRDGIVGPNTLAALNGQQVDPEAEIIANMERWRWVPRELGQFYVNVNVPEFTVRIVDDGAAIHQTRVVVGLPTHPSPIFSDEIEYLAVNPYWNVPASIISAEMMALLRSDPGYFGRNGFEVFVTSQDRTQQVDPNVVNWNQVSVRQVSMRQRPGPANALGRIKFLFPNRHSVYLHDTPSKSLFQQDVRAFSHGCVRVMNPFEFAEALLSQNAEWNAERLTGLFGDTEQRVDLADNIPVHITYFTAVVDETGDVQFKNDIYGYSAAVRERLGL